jgi:hypothetical protein
MLPGSNDQDTDALPDNTPGACGCWGKWMVQTLTSVQLDQVVANVEAGSPVVSLLTTQYQVNPAVLQFVDALNTCTEAPYTSSGSSATTATSSAATTSSSSAATISTPPTAITPTSSSSETCIDAWNGKASNADKASAVAYLGSAHPYAGIAVLSSDGSQCVVIFESGDDAVALEFYENYSLTGFAEGTVSLTALPSSLSWNATPLTTGDIQLPSPPPVGNASSPQTPPNQTTSIPGGTLCPTGANVSASNGGPSDWYLDVSVARASCATALTVVKDYGEGTQWVLDSTTFRADGFACVTKISAVPNDPDDDDEGMTTCTQGSSIVRWIEPPSD